MGDWGVNGVDIVIGKLMVYIVVVGINFVQVLFVLIDVGINNEELLNNLLYLGNCYVCVEGEIYYEFID